MTLLLNHRAGMLVGTAKRNCGEINCGDSRQSKVKFMNRQLQRRLWYNILAPKPWDLHMLPQWLSSLMTTFLKWRLAFLGIQLGHAWKYVWWKYVWNWSYFKQNSREPTLSEWATPNENTDRCQDLWYCLLGCSAISVCKPVTESWLHAGQFWCTWRPCGKVA